MRIALHVAVVAGVDGIWFVAAERSAESLMARLSELIRERAPYTLWPEDALAVERGLASGEIDVATERYFATVGQRWDREVLCYAFVRLAATDEARQSQPMSLQRR